MPRPIAVISSNLNPEYLSLIPLVCKSWELQGFMVYCIFNIGEDDRAAFEKFSDQYYPAIANPKYLTFDNVRFDIVNIQIDSKLNKHVYTQCCRLYAYHELLKHFPGDTYCIISDADMFIGSSFLHRDFDKVNVFGHDLTGHAQVPMCYVGMYLSKWSEVMGLGPWSAGSITETITMKGDLQKFANVNSDEWHVAWGADQDILTAKLKNYGFDKIHFINRGQDPANSHLPVGRLDRYNWKYPATEIHDMHIMRSPLQEDNFGKVFSAVQNIYPKQDWSWLVDFRAEFLGERSVQAEVDEIAALDIFGFLKGVQNWDNHRPLLWLALCLTYKKGQRTLELGLGDGSTPFIDRYIHQAWGYAISLDTNKEWASRYMDFNFIEKKDSHSLSALAMHVVSYLTPAQITEFLSDPQLDQFEVVLVDHAPGEQRHSDVAAMAGKAKIFILHDTEPVGQGNYMWDKIWHLFKYRINIKSGGAWASAVSNEINLNRFNGCKLGEFKLEI